jgi:hypothetical protein
MMIRKTWGGYATWTGAGFSGVADERVPHRPLARRHVIEGLDRVATSAAAESGRVRTRRGRPRTAAASWVVGRAMLVPVFPGDDSQALELVLMASR